MKGRPSYIETYGFLPEPCVRLLESGPDGEELMLRVIGKIGGGFLRIPVQLTVGCDLVTELGPVDAEAVWRVWRGRAGAAGEIRIHFPRMSAAHQKARRARLLSLLEAGVTVREAARRLNVTERTAYAMKAKSDCLGETAAGARRQLNLFPA